MWTMFAFISSINRGTWRARRVSHAVFRVNMDQLNERFFETILRKTENDVSIIVDEVNAKAGCAPGTNFMTTVSKVEILGSKFCDLKQGREPLKKSVMVKKKLKDAKMAEAYQSDVAFINEVVAYNKIIPALQKMNRNGPLQIPNCLHVVDDIIVLEDLSESGYSPLGKRRQMSFDESLLVLQELAKLHAASLALERLDTKQFEEISRITIDIQINSSETALLWQQYEITFDAAIFVLENHRSKQDFSKEIRYLKELKENFPEKIRKLFKKQRQYSVLNHGDCWTSNLLFNTPKKLVKLIDFQLMRNCSPAADLCYFLFVNLHPSLLFERMDECLHAYLQFLNDCARENGLDTKFSFEWLKKEITEFSEYGLCCGLMFTPIFTWDEKYFTRESLGDSIDVKKFDASNRLQHHASKHNDLYRDRTTLLVQKYLQIMQV